MINNPPRERISQRIGAASRVDLEYFCRTCKGHFASTVPVTQMYEATCRCGSSNLLVYNVAGELSAPLRPR